jgi:transposase
MRLPMTEDERTRLKQLAHGARDVRVRRRARALLDIGEGKSARVLSSRYHVARSTIYNWIKRYTPGGFIDEGLRDLPRSGRPRMARKPDDQGGGQPGA